MDGKPAKNVCESGAGGSKESKVNQMVDEVLRIKQILDNSQDEQPELCDSLRRLQLMILSLNTLMDTRIGRSVNRLSKHESKQISHLAKAVVKEWKVMVDEWVRATMNVAGTEGTPESVNPSVVDNAELLERMKLEAEDQG